MSRFNSFNLPLLSALRSSSRPRLTAVARRTLTVTSCRSTRSASGHDRILRPPQRSSDPRAPPPGVVWGRLPPPEGSARVRARTARERQRHQARERPGEEADGASIVGQPDLAVGHHQRERPRRIGAEVERGGDRDQRRRPGARRRAPPRRPPQPACGALGGPPASSQTCAARAAQQRQVGVGEPEHEPPRATPTAPIAGIAAVGRAAGGDPRSAAARRSPRRRARPRRRRSRPGAPSS